MWGNHFQLMISTSDVRGNHFQLMKITFQHVKKTFSTHKTTSRRMGKPFPTHENHLPTCEETIFHSSNLFSSCVEDIFDNQNNNLHKNLAILFVANLLDTTFIGFLNDVDYNSHIAGITLQFMSMKKMLTYIIIK